MIPKTPVHPSTADTTILTCWAVAHHAVRPQAEAQVLRAELVQARAAGSCHSFQQLRAALPQVAVAIQQVAHLLRVGRSSRCVGLVYGVSAWG
jgi:hypothetical protein